MRILFLSSWFPYPLDNGSKIRAYNLLRSLAAGHDVSLVSFNVPGETADVAAMSQVCRVVGVVPRPTYRPGGARAVFGLLSSKPRHIVDTFSAEMACLIEGEVGAHPYDAIVASEAATSAYVPQKTIVPAIYEDVELARLRDQYAAADSTLARLRYGLTWQKTQRYTRWLLRRYAACTVVSEQERAIVRDIAPGYDPIALIPNGVDTGLLRPGTLAPEPNTLIYSGALTYSANYDAVRFFLSEIWPLVRQAEPTTSLSITGKTDGVHLAGLALTDRVKLTGYLHDIHSAVARAWICIVPLRIGAGTRLKILEAMALGTPVISTSKGAEGLHVSHEENILIADTPQQFAAETIRLLRDPSLRLRLAENGRRMVESEYSWSEIGHRFVGVVESVVRRTARG